MKTFKLVLIALLMIVFNNVKVKAQSSDRILIAANVSIPGNSCKALRYTTVLRSEMKTDFSKEEIEEIKKQFREYMTDKFGEIEFSSNERKGPVRGIYVIVIGPGGEELENVEPERMGFWQLSDKSASFFNCLNTCYPAQGFKYRPQ